jgi:hypothetical protein
MPDRSPCHPGGGSSHDWNPVDFIGGKLCLPEADGLLLTPGARFALLEHIVNNRASKWFTVTVFFEHRKIGSGA